MGERIKRITGSLYWRQFMLTAGMVVLTLVLLRWLHRTGSRLFAAL